MTGGLSLAGRGCARGCRGGGGCSRRRCGGGHGCAAGEIVGDAVVGPGEGEGLDPIKHGTDFCIAWAREFTFFHFGMLKRGIGVGQAILNKEGFFG